MRIGNYEFDLELARGIGENVACALVALLVTWLLAKGAKWAFDKLVDKVALLQRDTGSGESVGLSLGKIVGLFIWLFGLLVILDIFKLESVTAPLNGLLNAVMGFIPSLVGAALLFFIGYKIAGIVKDLVVTALQTVNFDKWANKGGVDSVTGNSAITATLGTIVYVLIIVPVAIGAIEMLGIDAVSGPATGILDMILSSIPNILVAALLLGIGYVISGFAGNILRDILGGFGVDRSVAAIGILPEGTSASNVIVRIAQVAILLFVAIGATRALAFPALTAILDTILGLGGRILLGSVVIGVGFLIARLLAGLVGGLGGGSTAGSVVKWSAVALFTLMGLESMGVREVIGVDLLRAFAVGGAVAGALAFGLGGRDWASRQLDKIGK